MAADSRILAAVILVLAVPSAFAQSQRCYYMTEAIPREPKPDDLPEIEWSGGWNDWPLIPADPRDDVCIDSYYPSTGQSTMGTFIVHIEEEIIGDVTIAKINYDGSGSPTIVQPLLIGQFIALGPEIRNVNGEWHLVITRSQDYEIPSNQRYTFDVRVPDDPQTVRVSLFVENIDDNDPRIIIHNNCLVPELGDPRLTDCVYEVQDDDGRLSIQPMTFRIDSDRGDDVTFFIHPTLTLGIWNSMTITIGLNTALDFEALPLHIFQVTALDSLPNTATVTIMVQVDNVEHRPPRWVEIFAVQQFDEKTYQNFTVRAIDRDTGIDKPIYYKLITDEDDEEFFSIETIPGGRDGATFYVSPIDRDALQRELFSLSIVAYKADNEELATETSIVIIINDINDQRPEPLSKEYFISFDEETPLTLNFDEPFGFNDRDLGVHAQYSVRIESEYPPDAEKAFYIAPQMGYQLQTFIMGTQDHSMLDFENPLFQKITLKVIATDLDDPTKTGVATVHISLINWNDEQPIFNETTSQVVSFDETEGAGFYVATIRATDRDIGDRVEHTLMGNAGTYLRIDSSTGEIFVSVDDAFDYHRQNELFVQIRADDTLMAPFHTTTSQLVIQLYDVNNTPPSLRLPRGSPSVEENVPEGYVISQDNNQDITATDPDTTALLKFEIDWEASYATKQGRDTDPIHFHGCMDIETIFPNPDDTGSAIGRLIVKEISPGVTIDFEEFEVLYLAVRVKDLNTVIGVDNDESTFAIIVIDMNDNAPIWAENSLQQNFRVRERSASDIIIGSVLATDIDGPLYNQVRYTISPREDTPDGLVKIDFYTGQITVDESNAIDADIPPRLQLYYTVVATDKCFLDPVDCPPDPTYWETPGKITIDIIDTNNKIPRPDYEKFPVNVEIYENAPNLSNIVQLFSIDEDRDEMYHTVRYQINYAVAPHLIRYFAVNQDTGQVYVEYTTNDVLDRDVGDTSYTIFLTLIDNFLSEGDGNRNQETTEIIVTLLDENDNAPELPDPSELSWEVSENSLQGILLEPEINATDIDEPNTPNSHVGYSILHLSATNRPGLEIPRLFNMLSLNNDTGQLITAMDLRGYWGTYNVHVLAFDHGIPQQLSDEVYEIIIHPYNYHEPVFVFPVDGSVIRLRREMPNLLTKINGDPLERLEATDEDGLHAGVVTFSLFGDDEAVNYFDVVNDDKNSGILMFTSQLVENIREFQVIIRATDGGTDPKPLYTDSSITLIFVPTQGDPIFDITSFTVSFFEREVGLTERYPLPRADDPKNYRCTDDCHDIYYRILDGNDAGHFALDPVENIIYLVSELDREEAVSHVLTIAASNSQIPGPPLANAKLIVNINVREAAPRPAFEQSLYTAGISSTDNINRELITIRAIHSEGLPITYSIDLDSVTVTDPSLESVRDSAFVINDVTGVLALNIQPTADMHGMFEFKVIATDIANETDEAEVKVYLISSQNMVFFRFRNTAEEIENNRAFIAQIFGKVFQMTCNIDQVMAVNQTVTEVRAHFIRDDLPVTTEEIDQLRNDGQLVNDILRELRENEINLEDFGSGLIDLQTVQYTIYVLAGLSAILAIMCLILLITFVVRTRSLNRRLEALSMTKYGSVDSGLNRMGLAAPGTNKHAVEGSNPIWNEAIKAPDFDALSDSSGDSDLIGIEDMPQFRSDYYPEDAESTTGIINDRPPAGNYTHIADHSNAFGFNTSPFSPEFINGQLKR